MSLPIFILTDFGLSDPFVGVMKAVMCRMAPASPLIDLTHLIPPQDVVRAALALEDATPWLPPACVVLAVVDPGVGTTRRALAARAGGRFFVGPDNGLFGRVFAVSPPDAIAILPVPDAPEAPATFHGRDVFAPAAARLATGTPMPVLGVEATGWTPAPVQPPHRDPDGRSFQLAVVAFDHFGNASLNLRREAPGAPKPESHGWQVVLESGARVELRRTYADVPSGGALAYWNSSGRLEIAVRDGSARERLGLARGSMVRLVHEDAR